MSFRDIGKGNSPSTGSSFSSGRKKNTAVPITSSNPPPPLVWDDSPTLNNNGIQAFKPASSKQKFGKSSISPVKNGMVIEEVKAHDSIALFDIMSDIDRLEELAAVLGTSRDSSAVRATISSLTKSIAKSIKSQEITLKKARTLDPSDDVHYNRLESGFKGVLARFQEVSSIIIEKTKIEPPVTPNKIQAENLAKSNKYYQDINAYKKGRNVIGGQPNDYNEEEDTNTEDNENTALLSGIQVLESTQLTEEIHFNSRLIEERDEDIRGIERSVIEVNEIFRDLGALVHEQQGLLDNIESNVEQVDVNMEAATKELKKAVDYQKRSRNRMCWVLVILVILFLIILLICLV